VVRLVRTDNQAPAALVETKVNLDCRLVTSRRRRQAASSAHRDRQVNPAVMENPADRATKDRQEIRAILATLVVQASQDHPENRAHPATPAVKEIQAKPVEMDRAAAKALQETREAVDKLVQRGRPVHLAIQATLVNQAVRVDQDSREHLAILDSRVALEIQDRRVLQARMRRTARVRHEAAECCHLAAAVLS
jgi:hypothetical protein